MSDRATISGADHYHTYEPGRFDELTGWVSLWIAAANNPKNIKGIYVDRIWLVQEE